MRIPFFDCRACVESASDFRDGRLPPVAGFVTRVHLRLCRDCRVHLEQLETTVKALRAEGARGKGLGDESKRALLEGLRKRK
jgi:hypothetical protein